MFNIKFDPFKTPYTKGYEAGFQVGFPKIVLILKILLSQTDINVTRLFLSQEIFDDNMIWTNSIKDIRMHMVFRF